MKVSDIITPHGKDLVQIVEGAWWIVTETKDVAVNRSGIPMFNWDWAIATRIRDTMYPGASVRKLEVAFVPIKIEEGFNYDIL